VERPVATVRFQVGTGPGTDPAIRTRCPHYLEVVKHANLHCMEEVGLREVAHDTGNMSNRVESSVDMVRREFSIGYLGVGIAERLL